uniref:Protein FAR1-RELATED SEQUENCE n=1 Tax=Lactuca sativa TaxID=4236 RepID=A0A9R1UV78_LACSA|nr:hypothetical protein LSAT_V11C700365420 [Lactuca sativa]
MMSETEAYENIEAHTTEDVDANDLLEATYETEEIKDANVECEEDGLNNESILGKVFDTTDDAYNFYNDYAFVHGFGIRIHTTCKNKGTNEPYRKTLVCDKEGFKREDGNTSIGNEKKRRREVRIGCKAMFRISKKKDGKWFVDLFDDTHNHELSMTPTKVMKHRSHAKFHRTMECKSLMVELNQVGLKPSQIKKAINAMKTSNEVDVTSKQCVDVLSEQRKHNKGREFYGLIKHLQDKALVDNDRYYVVDLCSDGCPRNIFWADGRSRDDFTKFGDVVVFDVTYMTNKFKMPFAPFTGVNHHGQSVLFGGALLENEKEETFVWLFEHFLKLQYDKAVASRRAVEEDEDFKTMNSRPVLSSRHPIEAKAGECYTRKVGKRSIGLEEMNNGNGFSAYTLWCVCSNFNKVIEQAKDSPSEIENVNNVLIKLLQDQAIRKKPLPVENVSQGSCVRISQVDMLPQLFVRDPLAPTNMKGRPKIASRIKSSLEVPKKRTCSYCQELGHYATSCSKRKVDESLQEKH